MTHRRLLPFSVSLAVLLSVMSSAPLGCAPPSSGGGGPADERPVPDNDNQDDDNVNGNDNVNVNENVSEQAEGADLPRFAIADFAGSGTCTACHDGLADEEGNDVSIPETWRATVLANAATDPLFVANVEVEVAHAPGELREVVEDTCAACHLPIARTQAVTEGSSTLMLEGGFLAAEHDLHEPALDGVSCTVCHQIQDQSLGEQESFSGGYVIDTSTEAPDRLLYGPYPEPQSPGLMQGSVGYTPVEGSHLSESALCATCHTLFTPTLDAEGNIVGEFPEQVAFLEWQHSRFGDGAGDDDRSCQDCHMPLANGAVAISRVPPGLDARETFRQHTFRGGNVLLLRMLRDNVEDLGLTASTAAFEDSIAATEALLADETGTLSIEEVEREGDTLTLTLAVGNLAGHKFPTGFPSRRAWLYVSVTDADGDVLFESGAPQNDGSIAGNDADTDAALVEPHYDVVTSEDQVPIYESIMQDTEGAVTYVLLRGATYRKDNRLLPAGFDPATAADATAVMGVAADDPSFTGGTDRVTYQIDVGAASGSLTVSAELLFQSVSYRFAHATIEEDGPRAAQFGRLYEDADKSPTVVALAEASVE